MGIQYLDLKICSMNCMARVYSRRSTYEVVIIRFESMKATNGRLLSKRKPDYLSGLLCHLDYLMLIVFYALYESGVQLIYRQVHGGIF